MFPLVSAPLTQLCPLVEGRFRIRETDEGRFAQTYSAPMIARRLDSGSLLNEPFHCRDEVIGTNLPDVSGERGLLPLVVIKLLDRFDLPCPFVGEGLHRGIKGGPMLSDPGL